MMPLPACAFIKPPIHDQALEEIRRCSGTAFDPDICKNICSISRKISIASPRNSKTERIDRERSLVNRKERASMKNLIVYFTQGGTTAKVAEAIAAGLRSKGARG